MRDKVVGSFTSEDAKQALLNFALVNKERAKIIERIMRWETAHFTSYQYKVCGSAGMEIGNWTNLPSNIGTIRMKENGTGIIKEFIIWRSVGDFIAYLDGYITRHGGNWARWYSSDISKQSEYRAKVNSIKNRYIV